jgi:uncharacterized protein YceK
MRLIALASLLVAIAVGISGCGSSSSETSGAGSAQSAQPPAFNQQARAQFRTCMQSQGVTLPNGRPQRGRQPDAKTLKALQACRKYLPQGGFGGQGA